MVDESYGLDRPMPETPLAANREIDVIFRDNNHPYFADISHPLRKRAQARVTELFEIRSGQTFDKRADSFAQGFAVGVLHRQGASCG